MKRVKDKRTQKASRKHGRPGHKVRAPRAPRSRTVGTAMNSAAPGEHVAVQFDPATTIEAALVYERALKEIVEITGGSRWKDARLACDIATKALGES